MLKCNYTEKKREENRKKVLRFEPRTAYMWIMYDYHHVIEAIIKKCRILVNLDMRMCVNSVHYYIQWVWFSVIGHSS